MTYYCVLAACQVIGESVSLRDRRGTRREQRLWGVIGDVSLSFRARQVQEVAKGPEKCEKGRGEKKQVNSVPARRV